MKEYLLGNSSVASSARLIAWLLAKIGCLLDLGDLVQPQAQPAQDSARRQAQTKKITKFKFIMTAWTEARSASQVIAPATGKHSPTLERTTENRSNVSQIHGYAKALRILGLQSKSGPQVFVSLSVIALLVPGHGPPDPQTDLPALFCPFLVYLDLHGDHWAVLVTSGLRWQCCMFLSRRQLHRFIWFWRQSTKFLCINSDGCFQMEMEKMTNLSSSQ